MIEIDLNKIKILLYKIKDKLIIKYRRIAIGIHILFII